MNTVANFLVVAISSTTIVLSLYHWISNPIHGLGTILSRIGIIIAIWGVFQLYNLISLAFVNYYGAIRYIYPFCGTLYSSEDYPWLIYATFLPVIVISALFWIPGVRSNPLWASLLCFLILLPAILDGLFPAEFTQPESDL